MRYPHPKSQRLYMYYKLGQTCITNWGSFVLLESRANVVTNWGASLLHIGVVTIWGSYYKLGQPLLQNRQLLQIGAKFITNWDRYLQIRTIITNWCVTICS